MIVVAGGKGGCGKTTTALGLASVLGERAPVTLVDADVDMPDLHVLTDAPVSPGLDDLAAGSPLADCRHGVLDEPAVSLVPAGIDGTAIEGALQRLAGLDEQVVVDTPAGASVDVTRPLGMADRVVLVSTPTRESLVDTAKTAAMARRLGTPVAGVVVNRSDGTVDPTPLLDATVLGHVPTVSGDVVHRVARASYETVAREVDKRNT